MHKRLFCFILVAVGVVLQISGETAFTQNESDAILALAPGQRPQDIRIDSLRSLNSYFQITSVASKEEWVERARQLRRQIRVAIGLWPWPTKVPLNAVITNTVERGEYTVESVYLQSWLGHYVTGSLYRSRGRSGKRPAVLSPHGHWENGRFHDHGADRIREEIAAGAERFEVGGRHVTQSRCVQLTRMGCVVSESIRRPHGEDFRVEVALLDHVPENEQISLVVLESKKKPEKTVILSQSDHNRQ